MEARETSDLAITAFVFAVLGWTFFPLFGSVAALIYAARAAREIGTAPDAGIGLVRAAENLAWVNLLVWLLVIALAVVVGALVGF